MAYLGGLAAFGATTKNRLSPTSPASIPSGGPGRNRERRRYRPADTATRPGQSGAPRSQPAQTTNPRSFSLHSLERPSSPRAGHWVGGKDGSLRSSCTGDQSLITVCAKSLFDVYPLLRVTDLIARSVSVEPYCVG